MAWSLASVLSGIANVASNVVSSARNFVAQVAVGAGRVASGQVSLPQFAHNYAEVLKLPARGSGDFYTGQAGTVNVPASPLQRAIIGGLEVVGAIATGGLIAKGIGSIEKTDFIKNRISELSDDFLSPQPEETRFEREPSIFDKSSDQNQYLDEDEAEGFIEHEPSDYEEQFR